MSAELVLFMLASLVVAVSPGPAVLYIVARSLDQGLAAGLTSMAGITTGGLIHVLAAAAGVAALTAAWPASLTALQVLGAAYLIWLGLQRIRAFRKAAAAGTAVHHQPLAAIYRQGIIVNVLNPKTALFMLAFLPQFLRPERGPVWLQMLLLGLGFILIASLSDGVYALIASSLREWLHRGGTPRWPGLIAAAVYIGLGILGLWDASL